MKWRMMWLATCIFFLFACADRRQISPAYYYWRTNLNLSAAQRLALHEMNVEKLYVKFFDVDWSKSHRMAVPDAVLTTTDSSLNGLSIVPVIFITNRTFLKLPASDTDALAGKILNKIDQLYNRYEFPPFREIQIDCDWSGKTQKAYFHFLKILKKKLPEDRKLSATIRLHQLKYARQTGIPPVHRGMLMFYNTGKLEDWATDNAILDIKTAKLYLQNYKHYPLPLDVVLPLYQWGVLFRDGRLINLINDLRPAALSDTSKYLRLDAHRYTVKRATILAGYFLYENDKIRVEKPAPGDLQNAAALLNKYLKKTDRTIAFYHLHPKVFEDYSLTFQKDIIATFE